MSLLSSLITAQFPVTTVEMRRLLSFRNPLLLGLASLLLLASASFGIEVIPTKSVEVSGISVNIRATRRPPFSVAPQSRTTVSKSAIAVMPQGDSGSLLTLLATRTPGVVEGTGGVVFFRGNHGNVQYVLNGVPLPDSAGNPIGEWLDPRTIETISIITGGLPAEYGQRLAAVVELTSKSGPINEEKQVSVGVGSVNRFAAFVVGGSAANGDFRYQSSGSFNQSNRGLDTPQPISSANQTQGTSESVHNNSTRRNFFASLDWAQSEVDNWNFIASASDASFEIPNMPDRYRHSDPIFHPGYTDPWGNVGRFIYRSPTTNAIQNESQHHVQLAWRRQFNPSNSLLISPYIKNESTRFIGDSINDLAGPRLIPGTEATSIDLTRKTTTVGIQSVWSIHADNHWVKAGLLANTSQSKGSLRVQKADATTSTSVTEPIDTRALAGGLFLQDQWALTPSINVTPGLRWDTVRYQFRTFTTQVSAISPRLGASMKLTSESKIHAYYGRLFQPAPAEDLRFAFAVSGNEILPYDVKPEIDDYYEIGWSHATPTSHLDIATYLKNVRNVIDEAPIGNSNVTQPFNLATGLIYGVDVALGFPIADHWVSESTYAYAIARGQGISGGLFAAHDAGDDIHYLDHMQGHTASTALMWTDGGWWSTGVVRYGSGLRTGDHNSVSLPAHLTLDYTLGLKGTDEHGEDWSLSGDILNVFDNRYPITIANGFSGSHYASGRTFMVRFSKGF